ncbi:MAG: TolC family protein, partial [Cyanobacteria bacterium]|nr:TolC family protein [Cyanobacteriota bacterium]
LTRSGMKVFAGMRLNPNDTKTPFVPTGNSGEYYAGVSVPLLRGRAVNEKTIAERQAQLSQPVAQQVYLAARMEVLIKAAGIYWEWLGAKSRLLVSNNLLVIAEQRVNQIKERVKSGDAPALEITEAEQEIERRKAGVVKAQRDLQKTSIQMSVYLWRQNLTPDTVPLLDHMPDLNPFPERVSDESWAAARKLAIQQRPELKRISGERKIVMAELQLAKNQLLPVMDAYALQGADTGKNGIGPVVRGGVNVSIPLRQRTARGLILTAETKLQKLTFDEAAERQRIIAEVDDVVSAINMSFEKYSALAAEVNKAKSVESGEKLRFAAGDSTLFLVNQRERATAEAQVRLIDAHVEYLQALTAFDIITCKL